MALWKKIGLWIVGILTYLIIGVYVTKYGMLLAGFRTMTDTTDITMSTILWPAMLGFILIPTFIFSKIITPFVLFVLSHI